MANFFSQIPLLNNIQFVPEGWELPSQYHYIPRDREWYHEHIRTDEFKRNYFQPVQQDDKQFLVLKRTQFNDAYFYIYDCNMQKQELRPAETGDNKFRFPARMRIDDSGDVYVLSDGTEEPLSYHWWDFRFSDFNLLDGIYYIYVVVEYYDGVTLVETRNWISEPIDLKTDHENTLLIQYYNNSNKDDIIFKYDAGDNSGFVGGPFVKPTFGLRVDGTIFKPKVASNDIGLKEQDYEQRLINSFRWDAKMLYIGDNHGVPFYMLNKLNTIFGCDVVMIDGRRYIKDDNAEWQIEEADQYPLYTAELQIRDFDKNEQITDLRGQTVPFLNLTGSYPVAVYQTGLGLVGVGTVLDNDTERDDFIDDLNNIFLERYGFVGQVQLDGENITYTCGVGENPTLFTPIVTYDFFTLSINVSSASQKLVYGISEFFGVVDWGEEIYTGLGTKYQSLFVNITTTETFVQHTYANTGNYTVRIFHFSPCRYISFVKGTGTGKFTCNLLNVTGDMPSGLRELIINGANFSGVVGGFSLEILAPCRQNIESFTIRNSHITQLASNIFADYSSIGIGGNSANWLQLVYVSIFQNGLSLLEQEAFIDDFYVHAPHVTAGSLITRQSPTNTITSVTTLGYLTNLDNAGWFTLE